MGKLLDSIRAGYDAYDAGDEERFRTLVSGLLADDREVTGPQYDARGAEEILPIWLAFAAAFPDGRHEWRSAVEHEGGAVFEHRYTGTHTAPLALPDGDLPATGRRVELESAVIVTADGGKVTSWHEYMDTLAFAQQLGLAPEAAQAQGRERSAAGLGA